MIIVPKENILQYLLSSDFNDINNTQDYIDLLFLFRNEYRKIYNKNSSINNVNDFLKSEVKNKTDILNEKTTLQLTKIADLENEMHQLKRKLNRKLTLKERLKGEIHE